MHLDEMKPTTSALLVCEDRVAEEKNGSLALTSIFNTSRCNEPTLHVYEGERSVGSGPIPEKLQLYKCSRCGNVRTWGRV